MSNLNKPYGKTYKIFRFQKRAIKMQISLKKILLIFKASFLKGKQKLIFPERFSNIFKYSPWRIDLILV